MGCFDYACAVTGVSIAAGDQVLHVVVRDKSIKSAYDIMTTVYDYAPGAKRVLFYIAHVTQSQNVDMDARVTDLTDLIAVMQAVARFLFLCRINPFYALSGAQHFDQEEHSAHTLRTSLITQALAGKSRTWDTETESE